MLPTPRASDNSHGPDHRWERGERTNGTNLPTFLATPTMVPSDPATLASTASGGPTPAIPATKLPTPLARDMQGGARYDPDGKRGISMREMMHAPARDRWEAETLPTPTKRDKRMDAWSPAYDKRKSPTMDAVLDGAQTNRAPDKWAYARQIAALLTEAGLTGPSLTLPITYGWMMGYPPGWLASALRSAMARGSLLPASSSRRSATRSSRKSPKPSAAPSSAPNAP